MKRQHLKTEVRREQIANAALEVVLKEGVRAMTIERVAREVGLAPSALYRHYSGKMALLDAVATMLRDRLVEELSVAMPKQDDPVRALRSALDVIVGMVDEVLAIPRIMFSDEVFKGGPEQRQLVEKVTSAIRQAVMPYFVAGQEQGQLRNDIAPDQMAIAFMGLYVPCALLYHASYGEFDIAAQAEANWQVFVQGIVANK